MVPRKHLLGPCVLLLAAACLALPGCPNKANIEASPQIQIPEPMAETGDLNRLPPTVLEPAPYGSPANPAGTVVTPPPTGGRIHVVQKGDNYFRLAIKYYGSGSKANQDKLINANPKCPPTRMTVGATILVPD